jgi:NAD(P)-dependent dehydrogenase (short-subunit alcohol dehydrogenase family)
MSVLTLGMMPAYKLGVASALSQLGGLDVLVNCAGIGAKGGVCDNNDDEWHKVFDVNAVGMVRVIRAALPALLQSPAASIVNVSLIAATPCLGSRR